MSFITTILNNITITMEDEESFFKSFSREELEIAIHSQYEKLDIFDKQEIIEDIEELSVKMKKAGNSILIIHKKYCIFNDTYVCLAFDLDESLKDENWVTISSIMA